MKHMNITLDIPSFIEILSDVKIWDIIEIAKLSIPWTNDLTLTLLFLSKSLSGFFS